MIYVNGDSYSVLSGLDDRTHNYGFYLSKLYYEPLVNKAIPCSSNERILRTTIRDILKMKNDGIENAKVILGLTILYRVSLWYEDHDLPVWRQFDDDDGEFISANNIEHCPSMFRRYFKEHLIAMPPIAKLTELFSQLSAIKYMCENLGYQLYVFWAADERMNMQRTLSDNPKVAQEFLQEFDETNSFDLANFSFVSHYAEKGHKGFDYDKYGKYAHHNREVHELFAAELFENLRRENASAK